MMHFLADKELWPILKPDCVIQFGQIVVSKRVQQMVASWDNVEYVEVNPTMDSMNPTGKPLCTCKQVLMYLLICMV